MAASGRFLLALETATAHASVAVLDELGALQGEVTFRAQRTMSQRLAPAIGHLMADLDLGPDDIGRLAVGLGPGSFTSLRVGLAWAKGFALRRQVTVLGIGSLEALAVATPLIERRPVCAVIAAPKRMVYAALYARHQQDVSNCLFGPELIDVDDLAERLRKIGLAAVICGAPGHEAVDALVAAGATFVPRIHDVPRAAMCGWLARRRMDAGESHDPATLTPLYVHPSEAEVRFGRTVARAGGPDSADDQ